MQNGDVTVSAIRARRVMGGPAFEAGLAHRRSVSVLLAELP